MMSAETEPERSRHAIMVVLTGDIVGSSRLSPAALDAAMAALEEAAGAVSRHWGGSPPRFSRFRGDSWQCIGPAPAHCLRAALIFRAHLRSLGRAHDSRISIGIGPGHLPAGRGLSGSGGPAFEASGRGLDRMPAVARFALDWNDPPRNAGLFQAVIALVDELSRRWTPRQAEVLRRVLAPPTRPSQEVLAGELGIRQQVVARHLAAAGDWALRQALATLEGAP